jgi:uncharacterized iron-regulated membrane protein
MHSNTNRITVDEAVAIAQRQVPGARPFRVDLQTHQGAYWIAMTNHQDKIAGASNSVVVDAVSGKILSTNRSGDLSMFGRALAVNEAIHTGNIFGLLSRILMSVGSLLVVVEAVSGMLMWWKRSPVRQVSH